MIDWSDEAILDMTEIYFHTRHWWGEEQAILYQEFLQSNADDRLDSVLGETELSDRPGMTIFLAKWKSASHGHYLIIRRTASKTQIVRVLHSAMDLPKHL